MTDPLFVRCYRSEDRAACQALFDSNVPTSFLPEERSMFLEFLDRLPGPYIVLEDAAGRIVSCGGLTSRDGNEAILCWGMVEAQKRRGGIGRVLLRTLLAMSARLPGISRVATKTSPELKPYFEREGFYTVKVIENYVRPGVYMVCDLDAPRRAEIEARLSAQLAEGHRLEDGMLTAG
jgi:N-acetylglutamate synthase-like GNAT family acetyltransferase